MEIEPFLSQESALTSGLLSFFLILLRINQIKMSSVEEFIGKRKLL